MENNENSKFDFNNQNKGFFGKFKGLGLFTAVFWAFFFALALSNVLSPYFSSIISGLLSGITPLLIGIALAFVFYRLVDFIEKKLLRNAFKNSPYKFGIKRTISILTVFVIIFGIVALIISILIPKIIEVIQELTVGSGDGVTQIINETINDICLLCQKWFGADVSQDSIREILNSIFTWFIETIGQINNVLELSLSFLGTLFNIIMGLTLMVFILKDKEKISRFSRRFTYANFKKEKADEICVMTKNAGDILNNYIGSKLIEFVMIFVSLGFAFMFLGTRFTWELSLIIALFNFIPYFGIYIGSIPAILITLILDPNKMLAVYMAIIIIVITTLLGWTISPFIAGKKLKVNSLIVLSSIIIGGAMFGILGMLFAPPIAALISVVVMGNIELKENRIKYMKELNEQRKINEKEQLEQLGLNAELKTASIASTNEEKAVVKQEEIDEVKKEEKKVEVEKKVEPKKIGKSTQKKSVKRKPQKKVIKKNSEDKKEIE